MALGWQVDPTLTGDEIMRYLLSTAATGTDGNSIIDPVHFVETLKPTAAPEHNSQPRFVGAGCLFIGKISQNFKSLGGGILKF